MSIFCRLPTKEPLPVQEQYPIMGVARLSGHVLAWLNSSALGLVCVLRSMRTDSLSSTGHAVDVVVVGMPSSGRVS